jgi:hypothetical protein
MHLLGPSPALPVICICARSSSHSFGRSTNSLVQPASFRSRTYQSVPSFSEDHYSMKQLMGSLRGFALLLLLAFPAAVAWTQEVTTYHIINVTINTSDPTQLAINGGRVIWRETDIGSGTFNLQYYSGMKIFRLDSTLSGFGAAIDGDYVVWQSGTGGMKKARTYRLGGGLTQDIAAAEGPVVDGEGITWTLGDAVELAIRVTYQQMTTNGQNGWEQTKFKTIDSNAVVWGDFSNSTHAILFYSDGTTTTQLNDTTTLARDLLMLNDGYLIWRFNSDSLLSYDGIHPPVKFLDTVQAENPYVAGGLIGLFGSRIGQSVKHAWLYRIGSGTLIQLTTDSSDVFNVLCYGPTACWKNKKTERLMFYNGVSTIALSDSAVWEDYSYRGGKIVWSERRNGIYRIMIYDVSGAAKSQLTSGSSSMFYPVTDGARVIWYENPDYPSSPTNPQNTPQKATPPCTAGFVIRIVED